MAWKDLLTLKSEVVDLPDVWKKIHEIFDDFLDRTMDMRVWEKEDGLDGLISGLTPENLPTAMEGMKGMEFISMLDIDQKSMTLAVFTAGVRIGNELAKREAKGME